MLALSAALLVAATAPTEGWTASCWKASAYDRDGDGYADYHAHKSQRVRVPVSYAERGTCPVGWVKLRGDCNDQDPRVHPRRPEIPGNGRDDDCDFAIDEPALRYTPDGFGTQVDGFSMTVVVAPAPDLLYEAIVEPVGRPAERRVLPMRPLKAMVRAGDRGMARVRIDGLAPATVYRARIRILQGQQADAVGDPSDWYVTMTGSDDGDLARRGRIVRRALYEQALSSHEGVVGYRGRTWADGTRYGAKLGEPWCSEFYAWAGAHEVDGLKGLTSVSTVTAWFTSQERYRAIAAAADMDGARPGDFIAVDSSGDGTANHTGMLLYWDGAHAFTVEGNTTGDSGKGDSYASRRGANEIFFEKQSLDRIKGLGRL